MSFFSFLHTTKEEISLVLDIGSGTLGGALIKFKPQGLPEILYIYREPIISKRNVDGEALTQAMLKTLDNVCGIILRDGLKTLAAAKMSTKITNVHYVFSSPWILSQTKIIHLKKEKEIIVTRDLIDSIVKSEEKPLESIYTQSQLSPGSTNDMMVIEQNVVGVSLNGYETHDPFLKKAFTVDIPFFMSVSSKKLIERITAVVQKAIHFKSSFSHSCILLSFLTLRDIYHNERDFLFVDIHGELTDLSITKNGILVQTSSFPLGVSTIVRKVADELKTAPQVAESYIRLFLDGKSDDKVSIIMKTVLNKIKMDWLENFRASLHELHKEASTPQTIFLTVGNGMENFFKNLLQEEKFKTSAISIMNFNIIPLTVDVFSKFGAYNSKTEQDPFLAMHTIALNKLVEHSKII